MIACTETCVLLIGSLNRWTKNAPSFRRSVQSSVTLVVRSNRQRKPPTPASLLRRFTVQSAEDCSRVVQLTPLILVTRTQSITIYSFADLSLVAFFKAWPGLTSPGSCRVVFLIVSGTKDSRFFIVPECTGWEQKRYGLVTRKGGSGGRGDLHLSWRPCQSATLSWNKYFEDENTQFEV